MLKKLLIIMVIVAVIGSVGIGCKATTAAETTAAETTMAEETMAEETMAAETTMAEESAPDFSTMSIGFVNAGPDDYYAQFGNAFKAIGESYGFEVTG
jgi:hypothetical protein